MPITPVDDNVLRVIVASGCVIKQDGRFLLVQELKEHARELWNLPAGKVDIGLTFAENAAKEAKEETGYDVEIICEIGIFHKDGDKAVKHAFEAKIVSGELKIPADEIMDAKWFTLEEVEELERQGKLRNYWVIEAIRKLESK